MSAPRIELVYFAGCPNVEAARDAMREALAEAGLGAEWQEWDRNDPGSPDRVRNYGSPTVLVDGHDVDPASSDADCCRVYADTNGLRRAPDPQCIRSAIAAALGYKEEGESS